MGTWIETSGVSQYGWQTNGTMLGINAPRGSLDKDLPDKWIRKRIWLFNWLEVAALCPCYWCIQVNQHLHLFIKSPWRLTPIPRKACRKFQLGAADAAPVAQTLGSVGGCCTSNTAGELRNTPNNVAEQEPEAVVTTF